MIALPLLTAEQFAERKFELPDGGRWAELVRGVAVTLQPPDESQGAIVLNLTKAFGAYAARTVKGYACFELGLIVTRNPDTVWQPAVCWFDEGERFAEVDKLVTAAVPSLVVEIVSTNDRRRGLTERITRWHDHGVHLVWVIDPIEKRVHAIPRNSPARQLTGTDALHGGSRLEGFQLTVQELFAEPEWWGSAGRPKKS